MKTNTKTSVTERLTECLKKKKTGYMTLGSLPEALKKRLTGKSRPTAAEIEKYAAPYLGEGLTLRRGSRFVYLTFRLPAESLLLGILRKRAGKPPSANNIPFRKEEFVAVLNLLVERGSVLVKLNKDCKPLIYPAPDADPDKEEPRKRKTISEERFESAYRELEEGKFFVRVCDLRRRLDWGPEFDRMTAALRDAGKIQLQAGDTGYFSERDVADGFVDENGFRMLTLMWTGGRGERVR
jgi:hypothetical protein